MDRAELLEAYDGLRPWADPEPAAGLVVERFGDLVRVTGREEGFVESARDVGLRGNALDAAIVLHRDHFAARGEAAEWKTREHDLPQDLTDRLRRAGFVPRERETVLIGEAKRMTRAGSPPEGVRIRRTSDAADLVRIAALLSAVWGEDRARLADDLAGDAAAAPEDFLVLVAEAEGELVSAAC